MILEISTLLAFMGASLAVYFAPGVDTLYIASNSINRGLRAGLYAGGGIVIGVSIQALSASFGLTALFLLSPIIFEVLRWIGVAYLIYLGIKILRAGYVQETEPRADNWNPVSVLLKGIGINLLNPKISLFFVAFLPQFVDSENGSVFSQLLWFGLMFSTGSVFWCTFQALLFARIGRKFSESGSFNLWQRRVTGISFIGFAGLLSVTDLQR